MTTEEDPDLELYGVRPGVIAFFMVLISLIVPIGVIPFNAWVIFSGPGMVSDFMIYSLIWSYSPGFYLPFSFIPLFMLFNIWMVLPLTLFNIAYIYQIIRYYRGYCTRYSAIWVGLLSITVPTVFVLAITGFIGRSFVFLGPIPLQFIAGLIFLRKFPGPEMTSPWRHDLSERSWWKPKRPDWWNRMFPSSNETENQEPEIESKSEWLDESDDRRK